LFGHGSRPNVRFTRRLGSLLSQSLSEKTDFQGGETTTRPSHQERSIDGAEDQGVGGEVRTHDVVKGAAGFVLPADIAFLA